MAEGAAAGEESFAEELARSFDPTVDGWTTEVLSSAAGTVLKKLAAKLDHAEPLDPSELAPYAADDVRVSHLRPMTLDEVAGSMTVRRGPAQTKIAFRGRGGLAAALGELAAGLGDRDAFAQGTFKIKLKPIRVDLGDGGFETDFLFLADLVRADGGVQLKATWSARWDYPAAGDDLPSLRELTLLSYEEAELRHGAGTLFGDATAAAMAGVDAYETQVLPGIDQWLIRVPRFAGMSILGHHGLAVGDVDGDGLEDVYVTEAAGLPNRLYLQQADGTVRDASAEARVDWLDPSVAALLVDLDDDGDLDLALVTAHRLLLSENDGRGVFTLRAVLHEVATAAMSISAADYDEDGDLDLYVCGYNGERDSRAIPGPVPYHDARNGGRNALLENRGGFRFEDVTDAVGLDDNNHGFSFAAAWDDMDDDGDLDLYVANDFGRNNLYRNDAGRFTDIAAAAGLEDVASGMSAAWGDYDRDGLPDIYVGNMFSSAGHRIAFQRRFATEAPDQTVTDIRRMARGNTLFRNAGDGTFDDVTMDAGVSIALWAWDSRFADIDNDSDLDLVVSNGYVTNDDTGDL